jgi:hypothetical protein
VVAAHKPRCRSGLDQRVRSAFLQVALLLLELEALELDSIGLSTS